MNHKQAKKRVKELKAFYGHLATYLAVNLFLLGLNLITSPGVLWFMFPAMGWGIGLAIHASQVFWTSKDWEERKIQELTGLTTTRDELEKLSERTDNLVTILSGINWEKIDPEFLSTRDRLAETRSQIERLQDGGDSQSELSSSQVAREIEKLEALVTSPKFRFYDQAQRTDH